MKHDEALNSKHRKEQKHVIYSPFGLLLLQHNRNKSFKMSTLMDDKFESIFCNIKKSCHTHGSQPPTYAGALHFQFSKPKPAEKLFTVESVTAKK